MQKPENLRGAQVVFGPALAQEPFHKSLLSRGQKSMGKTSLNLGGAEIQLQHPLARITPEGRGNIFHGAPREPEFHGGGGAKPSTVGALFAFRNRRGKAATEPAAIAQHARREPGRPVDRTLGIGRRPDIQVRPGMIAGEIQRPPAIDVETIIRALRVPVAEGE